MSLPSGAVRIPRRSVTYEALDTFILANRYSNSSAGDIANQGNMWRGSSSKARRQAAILENVQDTGDLMIQALGYDRRAWVNVLASDTAAAKNTSLRPNSVYVGAGAFVLTVSDASLFKVGDRVTFLKNTTTNFEIVLDTGILVIGPSGSASSKDILLSTTTPGVSVTLELVYRDTTTLTWRVVAFNGIIATNITLS